ncbi:MAG TPA: DUF6634 family protein [Dongiaceae bacterium]|nr:DUF6634 family protein [Dongiaceae bacterium]HWA78753.1 DUF6634 family protein [Acetobacteraceae bacterium]
MRFAIVGAKGGSGRSVTALALAHGLALQGREVTLLEVLVPGRSPSINPGQSWPFGYRAIGLEEAPSGASIMSALAATEVGGDVVLDPPPLPPAELAELLPSLALVLLPLHPDPLDLKAGRAFLEELDRLGPGWKATPPRWVLHVDPVQSLRGSLALVDLLVRGWPKDRLPPMVLPWSLPLFTRPMLRGLLSAELPPRLAASCRILAIAALTIAEGSPEELLMPRILQEQIPEELQDRYRGEDRDLAEKVQGLAADLAMIGNGEGPSQSDLLGSPVLQSWAEVPFTATGLTGRGSGHPRLGSPETLTTSIAVVINEREGWARTLSRYYRLARKARTPQEPLP